MKNRNWTFPIVPYFTWKLEFISNILSMIAGSDVINFEINLIFLIKPFLIKTKFQYFDNEKNF